VPFLKESVAFFRKIALFKNSFALNAAEYPAGIRQNTILFRMTENKKIFPEKVYSIEKI